MTVCYAASTGPFMLIKIDVILSIRVRKSVLRIRSTNKHRKLKVLSTRLLIGLVEPRGIEPLTS